MMYDDAQSMTVIDGGIQTVFTESVLASPATAPSRQLVYLDFDGAETSYYNRDLDIRIDDIVVENPGFDDAIISAIVADLNALYGDDIHFTSSVPEEDNTPYSTIYIGVTSAFDEYGSFLGLAETVDVGNVIKNDNAFVLLDSTASTELVTSVIAHETEHLVGTLDHGGEGVERYTEKSYVSSGQVVTGRVLSNNIYLVVYGTVNDTTLNAGGTMENRGTANNTIVNAGGYYKAWGMDNHTIINSGGTMLAGGTGVNHTTVNSGGTMLAGGTGVNHTTVNNGGKMSVSSRGTVNNTTVNNGGYMFVSSGGTALNIVENGGNVVLINGAVGTFVPNVIESKTLYGTITVHSGTTANIITVSRGYMGVHSGGTANSITVNSGTMDVLGGIANSITVNSGTMYINSGGTANSTTVNQGSMYVSSAGTANCTTMNHGSMYVSSAGTANSTTMNHGSMYVSSAGTANSTIMNGGYMYVSASGTALDIVENGGFVDYYKDTHVTFAPNVINRLILSNCSMTLHSGTTANNTTISSVTMFVFNGGIANCTTMNNGKMYVSSGGTVISTTVNNIGYIYVSASGTANSTTVKNSGYMYVSAGGTANSTTVKNSGYMYVSAGGTANSTTVNGGGIMDILSGGTALDIIENGGCVKLGSNVVATFQPTVFSEVIVGGELSSGQQLATVHSGTTAVSTIIRRAGNLQVFSSGTAVSTIINSYGYLHVNSGGTAVSTIINSYGYLHVNSGGTAVSTTINSIGDLYVNSGGTAVSTTINSNGCLYVNSGGTAVSTTNSNGCLYVTSGGTAVSTINNKGFFWVSSGGIAVSTINNGGYFWVSSGGSAVSTTVAQNGFQVSSGGMAISTIISGNGFMAVYNNGIASATTVSSGSAVLYKSAILSGQFDVHGGAKVYVQDGVDATEAEITFHVEAQTEEDNYIILTNSSNVGLAGFIGGTYSITVDNEQEAGMYKLAQGAAEFEGEFTLKNTDGDELGTLTVNDSAVYAGTYEYALLEEEGNLTLSVGIIGAPGFIDRFAPVLVERLAVTVDGSDAVVEWDAAWDNIGVAGYQFRYSDSRELEGNGTTLGETSISLQDLADGRYFYQIRAFDAAGNFSDWSKIKSFTVGDAPPMYVPYSIPEAEYMYGCTATVVGMLLGYYDRYGYLGHDVSNLIDGIVELNARGLDGNAYDMDAFDTVLGAAIASPEYVAHFVDTTPLQEYPYTFVGDSTTLNTAAWNCIADFIGTGQWWRGNEDLSTTLYSGSLAAIREFAETEHRSYGELSVNVPAKYSDFLYGLDLYVQHAGYQLDAEHTYTMETDNNGGTFTFDDYMAEIDEGRPVIVSLEGHTVLGYGYDASTQEIIFDDTYEHECRMTWGGEYFYSDVSRPMESVTIVQFATKRLADYDVHVTKVEEQETESGALLDWRRDSTTTWADAYEVSLALGNGEITLTGFPIAGVELLNAKYYRVSVSIRPERIDIWTKLGELEIATENLSASPQVVTAEDNGLADVMFGRSTGVWNGIFVARHTELGMSAPLEDKNIIGDIYGGSNDTSLLLLTDDANGDTLFVDDIFSAFPDGLEAQARIAKIDEIRAGVGNDVVDLTSQRFAYVGGGMTVHGGLGDDVIWANSGDNWLFGDAGNDNLVGAGGNDVLVGGAGDDTLHGGGGDDLFAFGGDWGNDTVEQLARSKVTLWFQDGDETNVVWNAEASTLTYTDGNNSVTVTGVSKENITLKFGDDGSEQYRDLLASGAFNEFTSERIFENKGMLA